MDEMYFGLKKQPFCASTTGTDVFVGPQIADKLAGLKNALKFDDAFITVTGPIGSGKTTLVGRALESNTTNAVVIRIPRLHFNSRELLELLVDELGIEEKPDSTYQLFISVRRRLAQLTANNSNISIVVEDAIHIDANTLSDIEALSATEAGVSEGSTTVVLMGTSALDEMLRETRFARIQQRIRLRLNVDALPPAELRGYLRHCFRLAGRDFEHVFQPDAATLLHRLSDGIPRVVNQLVNCAMSAAAQQNQNQVATALLARIARVTFGLRVDGFDTTQHSAATGLLNAQAESVPELAPVVNIEATVPAPIAVAPRSEHDLSANPASAAKALIEADIEMEAVVEPALESEVAAVITLAAEPESNVESVVELEEEPENEVQAVVEIEEEPDVAAVAEIPELIQDTRADLVVLTPELSVVGKEPITELSGMIADNDDIELADWDREPTNVALKPDLEALEQAMALAKSDPSAAPPHEDIVAQPAVAEDKAEPPTAENEHHDDELDLIPEITLDHAIDRRIARTPTNRAVTAATPKAQVDAETKPKSDAESNDKPGTDVDSIVAEIGRAKSIEDMDDRMAETLFGDDLSFVAEQFLSDQPAEEPTSSKPELAVTAVAKPDHSRTGPMVEVTLSTPKTSEQGGMDLSASQRMKTVRALNADLHPSSLERNSVAEIQLVPETSSAPESIEDQINTSMTQTQEVLKMPPADVDIDDESHDDEHKRGFFSRFKRS